MCSLKAEGCWVAVVFKLNYTTLIRTVGIILALLHTAEANWT